MQRRGANSEKAQYSSGSSSTTIKALRLHLGNELSKSNEEKPSASSHITFSAERTSPQKYKQLKLGRAKRSTRSPRERNIVTGRSAIEYSEPKVLSSAPPWFHPVSIVQVESARRQPQYGVIEMDEWLATFESDVLQYESNGAFVEVKLREALSLSEKIDRTPNRFRTAVCCALMERMIFSIVTTTKMKKYSNVMFRLRDEVYQSVYNIHDQQQNVNAPRTLSYFMELSPYFSEMQNLKEKNRAELVKHQMLFRKFIEESYQTEGRVFQAWKQLLLERKEDEINHKGAQLTAFILASRGKTRLIFNVWVRYALSAKLERLVVEEK